MKAEATEPTKCVGSTGRTGGYWVYEDADGDLWRTTPECIWVPLKNHEIWRKLPENYVPGRDTDPGIIMQGKSEL